MSLSDIILLWLIVGGIFICLLWLWMDTLNAWDEWRREREQ